MSDRIAVFNKGKIEQIATPRDLYHQPRTRFVADFVGRSNVIDAELAANIAGKHQAFAVRQENVCIAAEADTAPSSHLKVQGEVLAIQFLGANQRIEVQVGSQVITTLQADGEAATALASRISAGQRVTLTWAPEHMVLLDA
jgi:putative spermidine/putrescine transport system ATP-binding protein